MGNITILLDRMRGGNAQARSALFTEVYDELTRLARRQLGDTHLLDPPSVVHEAYIKLSGRDMGTLQDRREFFAYCAEVMRNVVIDIVRVHTSQKRGSGKDHLTLSNIDLPSDAAPVDAEALHAALEHLERIDERAHRIVEMRYFAGMSIDEIATTLDVSTATVKRSWTSARAFLFCELRK